MQTVAVIDYGMGNLHSVAKALEHVGAGKVLVTSDAQVIREADRVVFPGVGAIRDCMAEIKRLGFDSLVREVSQDRPFLGICVGMQALLEHSEENDGVDCISLFPGKVRFFGKDMVEDGEPLKVPHMGWNEVAQSVKHPLWHNIPDLAPSTSCTAITSRPATPSTWWGAAITARISLRRWQMVRVLLCSSTRKRATPTACSCCRTSLPGMVAGK
jgi:imidazole glycerol phosphate synthase glutamine amidotransferase subunit